MELDKDLIKSIDELLEKLFKDGYTSIHSGELNIKVKAIHTCKALDLIRLKSNSSYELAEKGVFAIQDGGIEKYLSNIRTEKNLDFVIKDLTSKRLKYDVWYNIMYVLIGALIGFITTLAQPDNALKYIEELHKSASNKTERVDNLQKRLTDMNTLILELQTELDSLKK